MWALRCTCVSASVCGCNITSPRATKQIAHANENTITRAFCTTFVHLMNECENTVLQSSVTCCWASLCVRSHPSQSCGAKSVSVLPHLCPARLCFSCLSISIKRVQSFLLRDGIHSENSGEALRKGKSTAALSVTVRASTGHVCRYSTYLWRPACEYTLAYVCVHVIGFAHVCMRTEHYDGLASSGKLAVEEAPRGQVTL